MEGTTVDIETEIATLRADVEDLKRILGDIHQFVQLLQNMGAQAATQGGPVGMIMRNMGIHQLGG